MLKAFLRPSFNVAAPCSLPTLKCGARCASHDLYGWPTCISVDAITGDLGECNLNSGDFGEWRLTQSVWEHSFWAHFNHMYRSFSDLKPPAVSNNWWQDGISSSVNKYPCKRLQHLCFFNCPQHLAMSPRSRSDHKICSLQFLEQLRSWAKNCHRSDYCLWWPTSFAQQHGEFTSQQPSGNGVSLDTSGPQDPGTPGCSHPKQNAELIGRSPFTNSGDVPYDSQY